MDSLLPAGEGGRDGPMRVTGSHLSQARTPKVNVIAEPPHPPLRGTFSRGEKERTDPSPNDATRAR